MKRNLKALGLAMVAAFAMSAVAASAAQAEDPFHFYSGVASGDTTVTGTQAGQDFFTTDSGQVFCETATYHGTIAGQGVTTVEVTPTYDDCFALGGLVEATIDTEGCHYLFHTGTWTTEEDPADDVGHGTVDIDCGEGHIEVTTGGLCDVTVPSQDGLSSVTFSNGVHPVTGNDDVTVDVDISGITYKEAGSFCSSEPETLTHNGTYEGAATVTGDDDEDNPVDIWAEPTEP